MAGGFERAACGLADAVGGEEAALAVARARLEELQMPGIEIAPVDQDRAVVVERVVVGEEIVELALLQPFEQRRGERGVVLLALERQPRDDFRREYLDSVHRPTAIDLAPCVAWIPRRPLPGR